MTTRTAPALVLVVVCVSVLAITGAGAAPGPAGPTDAGETNASDATDRGNATKTDDGGGEGGESTGWTQYRAGPGRTGATDDPGPRGPAVGVRWQYDGGEEDVPPVIAGGTVYVGATTCYGRDCANGTIASINQTSGAVRWNRSGTVRSERTGVGAVDSLAVGNGLVYASTTGWFQNESMLVATRYSRLAAFDAATGETVWAHNGTGGDIVVAGDTLYAGGTVYDATTGERRWNESVDFDVEAVHDGTLYASYSASVGENESRQGIVARDAADLSLEWRWAPDADLEPAPFAVANGSVYATLGNNETYALDATDGSVRWHRTVDAPLRDGASDSISAPAVADGTVYVATTDGDEGPSAVHALDASDGRTRWRFGTPAHLEAPPAVSNSSVYVGGFARDLDAEGCADRICVVGYGLNATSGAERWNYTEWYTETSFQDSYVSVVTAADVAFLGFGGDPAPGCCWDDTLDDLRVVESRDRPVDGGPTDPEDEPPNVTIRSDPPNATETELSPDTDVTLFADATPATGDEIVRIEWEITPAAISRTTGDSITIDLERCEVYHVTVRAVDDDGQTTVRNVTITATA